MKGGRRRPASLVALAAPEAVFQGFPAQPEAPNQRLGEECLVLSLILPAARILSLPEAILERRHEAQYEETEAARHDRPRGCRSLPLPHCRPHRQAGVRELEAAKGRKWRYLEY